MAAQIDLDKCNMCGGESLPLCVEVCPEEAIYMSKTYAVTGHSRELMIFGKSKLYEIGGERHDEIKKWSEQSKGPKGRSHRSGDEIAPSTAAAH